MTAHMLVTADGQIVAAPKRHDTQLTRTLLYGGLAAADLLIVFLAFVASDLLRHGDWTDAQSATYFIIVPVFAAVSFYSLTYSYGAVVSLGRGVEQVAWSLGVAVVLTMSVNFAMKNSEDVSRAAFFLGVGISLIGLILVRLPVPSLVERLGARFMRRVLVVDGGFDAPVPRSFERIDVRALGIRPDVSDPLMLHSFSQLVAGADRVVVSCPVEHREGWSLYLKSVDCSGELLVPELHAIKPLHTPGLPGMAGIPVSTGSMDMPNRIMKRMFDLSITVPAIILLSPVLIAAAVAVKLDSPGPVLFRQRRMGRASQLFDVYKFRSMHAASADAAGNRSAGRDDERITRVGRFIRATSIDELPQLFNVLNGDMSLVGPRPHALGSRAGDALFWQVDERYWLRHAIKPGLTGLAQVRGFRGATDHRDDLSKRLQSDLDYLSNWSVTQDFVILMRTLLVLVHRNAY